jgi:RNA polymerase sigma-32 factor
MKFLHSEDPVLSEPELEMSESGNALKAYLREISKHPFMTREEETEMARRLRMEGDREAGQKIVLANLRFVVKIAFEYHNYHNVLDLIQEGNLGLVRAVGKYDPERGTRFTTYASFWIRAYILKYLMDTWSMVKVGTRDSHRRLYYSLKREKEKLEKSGIVPTVEVLADNLKTSTADIEDMELRLYQGDVSLDAPHYGDGDPLVDTIGSGEDIEEALIEKDATEALRKRLVDFKKRLTEKECFIFDNRIMAEEPLTLREIGERFNTSRESVRQIQVKISRHFARNLRSTILRQSARPAGA